MTDERLAEIEARADFAARAACEWHIKEAQRERDEARAEVEQLRAELAQARAIIEGRPNPPTTAEKMAHRCDAAEGWDANGAPTR